jgi:hypothetical protein
MSEYTTDHDLQSYEHDACEHQFIEGNLNCVLCGHTIITTTGNVGPGTTQPTAKIKVKNNMGETWLDRLRLSTIITNNFDSQEQMEMFNVGFIEKFISNLLKEKTDEILKIKEAVREKTGSFKYDDCYNDCIKIIRK